MKKNLQSLVIAIAITLTSFGQSTDPIVLKIDGNEFNISEFQIIFIQKTTKTFLIRKKT